MAFNFDDKIKKALGKKKSKNPFSFSSMAKTSVPKPSLSRFTKNTPSKLNTKGASIKLQKEWRSFSPRKQNFLRQVLPDSDKDRVPNRFDCRPFNPRRQDDDLKCKKCKSKLTAEGEKDIGVCGPCMDKYEKSRERGYRDKELEEAREAIIADIQSSMGPPLESGFEGPGYDLDEPVEFGATYEEAYGNPVDKYGN